MAARNAALPLGPAFDPTAPGPGDFPETNVDYRELELAYEFALSEGRFSLFAELPVRIVELRDNAFSSTGISDLRVGAKLAMVASENSYLTFQFRAYLPTGEPLNGLGTDHASLEPGLLLFRRLTDRLTLGGELKYWHPTSGSIGLAPPDEFSGDILRYGVGLAYDLTTSPRFQLTPVVEVVGWRVLDGFTTGDGGAGAGRADSDIVNLKVGARIRTGRDSVYFGYGFALTQDIWYDDVFRLEYRLRL